MRGRLSLVRRSTSSDGRSERSMPEASLRERLTRLGAPPRPRPQRSHELPSGFEEMPTPYGVAAFRQEVIPLPPRAAGRATFHGGSFDLPVLRTRWVMARMPGEFSHAAHVDLLTLVRALYRHRLEMCNLRFVEQRVLGYERDDPLPSALVPDAYFD